MVRTALGLDDPEGCFVLHPCSRAGEQGMQVFPRLRLDPQGKGIEVCDLGVQAGKMTGWALRHTGDSLSSGSRMTDFGQSSASREVY
jgi:hypothetical protein